MKITFYLQHPLMAMHDPRMQNLVAKETLKGLGAYWFILEKLALLPESRAQVEYLHSFCKAYKISFAYIKKVILGYQLFDFEEDGYFMPAELNPVRKRIKKDIEVDTNDVQASEKEIQKTLKNEQKSSKSEQKMLENEPKMLKNEEKKETFYSGKSLKDNSTSPKMHTTNKENIKDIITSAAEKEKIAADDDDFTVVDCGGEIPTLHHSQCHTSSP